MKAIDLREALIEANNVNLNGADALVETRAMRQLIESCKARIEELEPEATELAKEELAKLGVPKGQFLHEGYKFEAQRTDEYDFVGKPQKYTMPEGVTFRQKTAEQKDLKAKSSAITKALKAIKDAFPITHPNIEPDSIDYTVKCID